MVAGIGASAGGVPALRTFFKGLPESPNLAFVVVLHSQPDNCSRMTEVLRACTRLHVCEAEEGVTPQPNHVYVARPADSLALAQGVFRSQAFTRSPARPGIDTVDHFLESLAKDRGDRAIAVVLSGTGSDGAAGAMRVKQHGGIVFVQDPATAEQDSMPRAAIRTGAVDHVLPVEHIAQEIVACGSDEYVSPARGRRLTEAADALDTIFALVRDKAGFDLSGYKVTPLVWRIQRRLSTLGLSGFTDYASVLQKDSAELQRLLRDIPIHVTRFFRDPQAWEALESEVIDRLFQDRDPADPIRVWSAACASGEEAYSVAMLLSERASRSQAAVDFRVLATDASPEIVAKAARGIYSQQAMAELTGDREARFFRARGDAWQVRRALRQKLVFAPQHLITDAPFRRLDLVICRNLLIYLDTDAARRVVFLLHSALRTGGYLFLGASESPPLDYSGLETISAPHRIFRKTGEIADAKVSFPRRLNHLHAVQARAVHGGAIDGEVGGGKRKMRDELRISHEELDASREELQAVNEELRAINEQLNLSNEDLNTSNSRLQGKIEELQTQASVLSSGGIITLFLDDQLQVRWFTPATDALFPLRRGDIGRPITDLTPRFHDPNFVQDVLHVMRTEEVSENQVRTEEGIWYARRILPFHGGSDTRKGVAVTFADITGRIKAEEALQETQAQLVADLAGMRRLYDLHAKLLNESSLNTALDQIIAAALAFVGADRGTVQLVAGDSERMELVRHRGFGDESVFIDRLRRCGVTRACDDATRAGQQWVVEDVAAFPAFAGTEDREAALAAEVRAMIFTPMITRAGKLIGLLGAQFREPHRSGEHERRLLDLLAWTAAEFIGRHYAELALEMGRERMQRVPETETVGVLFFSKQGVLIDANDVFMKMSGWSHEDIASGKLDWRRLTPPEYVLESEAHMELLARTGRIGPYEKEYIRKDGSRSWMLFAGRDLGDGTIAEYAIDVGDRKRAEEALRENEQRFRAFVMGGADVVYRMNADWSQMWQLHGAGRIPDLPEPTTHWLDVYIHPEDRDRVLEAARTAIDERGIFDAEYRVRRTDGGFQRTHSRAVPILNERGEIKEWLGTVCDVAEIEKQAGAPAAGSRCRTSN